MNRRDALKAVVFASLLGTKMIGDAKAAGAPKENPVQAISEEKWSVEESFYDEEGTLFTLVSTVPSRAANEYLFSAYPYALAHEGAYKPITKKLAVHESYIHWLGPEDTKDVVRSQFQTFQSDVYRYRDAMGGTYAHAGGIFPSSYCMYLRGPETVTTYATL